MHHKIMDETTDTIRMTLALSKQKTELIHKLADALDIDQGKAIRWIIKTMVEMTELKQDKVLREKLTPRAKYMLDTLSSIIS